MRSLPVIVGVDSVDALHEIRICLTVAYRGGEAWNPCTAVAISRHGINLSVHDMFLMSKGAVSMFALQGGLPVALRRQGLVDTGRTTFNGEVVFVCFVITAASVVVVCHIRLLRLRWLTHLRASPCVHNPHRKPRIQQSIWLVKQ